MGIRWKFFKFIFRLSPQFIRDFLKYFYQKKKFKPKSKKINIKYLENEINILTPLFLDLNGDKYMRGGAERYLVELIKIIEELGYKEKIIVFQDSLYEWERTFKNIKIIGLGMMGIERYLNKKFHRKIPEKKLTIYHAFYLAYPLFHKNSIGISHGIFWDNPEFQKSRIYLKDKIRTVLGSIKNCNSVVSVDTNLINWLRTINYELSNKIIFIPNFVNIEEFKSAKSEDKDKEIFILYPRRLYEARGFWLTVKVIPYILKEFDNVKFVFVGEVDSEREYAELERLKSVFNNRIEWKSVDPEKMKAEYQKSHIVLIPSLYAEGTSLSLLEALASGNAVISSNVGGLTNIAVDNFNSLVINPKPEELYSAIKKLILDKSLRENLARKGIETAEAFNIKIWQNRWKSLLNRYL